MPLSSLPFPLLDPKIRPILRFLQAKGNPAELRAEMKVPAIKGVNFAGFNGAITE